jgi:hypothetical protein
MGAVLFSGVTRGFRGKQDYRPGLSCPRVSFILSPGDSSDAPPGVFCSRPGANWDAPAPVFISDGVSCILSPGENSEAPGDFWAYAAAGVVTEPNGFGPAVVRPYNDRYGNTQIRCFMPGAGT